MDTKEVAIPNPKVAAYRWVIPALAFFIPLFLSGPQMLVGVIVNCLLFLTAFTLPRKNQGLVAIAPSIGALLNGVLFGKFTVYLAYFLPFIWVGNYLLMAVFLRMKNRHPFLAIAVPSFAKASLLFVVAGVFFKAGIVPRIFLTAMGAVQLATALVGGLVFLGLRKFIDNHE